MDQPGENEAAFIKSQAVLNLPVFGSAPIIGNRFTIGRERSSPLQAAAIGDRRGALMVLVATMILPQAAPARIGLVSDAIFMVSASQSPSAAR